jgi:outer membrane protein TolC
MRHLLLLFPCLLAAESHRLSFDQAMERARREAPEVLLARFDEVQAQQAIRVAKDPFSPKVAVGSGLAYTYGFPMSIEGSAPSIFQAKISQSVFNRPQSYLLAKSRVDSQAVTQTVNERRDLALEKTAKLYLDANLAQRNIELLRQQISRLESVSSAVAARVEEGRALNIESRRASVNIRKAQQRLSILATELRNIGHTLAFVLGYPPEDVVEIEPIAAIAPLAEEGEAAAIQTALNNSRELKRLQLSLQAKDLEVRANRAANLPQIDLVGQYGLFARFNNFDAFFNRFQRNNALLGLSFRFPIVPGPAAGAQAAAALNEINRLRLSVTNTRNRVELETRKLLESLRLQKENRELAKLDLDVAREQVALTLAQLEEGRASRMQLEEARFLEAEKWIAYYEAQHAVDIVSVSLSAVLGELDQLAVR